MAVRGPSLLVGDLGGTRTRLAIYGRKAKAPHAEAVFSSRDHAGLEEIVRAFLASAGASPPAAAVVGVAGPVRAGVAVVTNLPWRLDQHRLSRALGIPRFVLLNDLAVAARGCLELPDEALVPLTPARPAPRGRHAAVIAAGTGLGEAYLVWDGVRHVAVPTEGGHADYAPQSPLEIELWHFLSKRYPEHVSYERIVSGDGLGALYDFFLSRGPREPRAVTRRLAEGDRNAAIAELGLARSFRPAALAVDLFTSIYGAEAGNMALRELTLGGVFVAGNIARRIVPERRELFLAAFRRKGRFAGLLSEVPVAVVTDPFVGVLGALAVARELTNAASG
jgi:glucokinase